MSSNRIISLIYSLAAVTLYVCAIAGVGHDLVFWGFGCGAFSLLYEILAEVKR